MGRTQFVLKRKYVSKKVHIYININAMVVIVEIESWKLMILFVVFLSNEK